MLLVILFILGTVVGVFLQKKYNKYKEIYSNFPQKLYDAMCNWEIKITD